MNVVAVSDDVAQLEARAERVLSQHGLSLAAYKEQRAQIVLALNGEGWTQRDIAAVLGVGRDTVNRTLSDFRTKRGAEVRVDPRGGARERTATSERPASDAPARSYAPQDEPEMSEADLRAAADKFKAAEPVIGSMFGDESLPELIENATDGIRGLAEEIESGALADAERTKVRIALLEYQGIISALLERIEQ